jgi:hypothetical protein
VLLEDLQQRLRQLEAAHRPLAIGRISSGYAALDRLLAERGFRRGTLVEWLEEEAGSGAGTLALAAAREACRTAGPLVVIDGPGEFYPPAAALLGVSLERTIVVRPKNATDEAWAFDQALRSNAVGAVLGWTGRLNQRTVRRWQLAAEASAGLGLLIRPARARSEPCWSEVRLLVTPLAAAGKTGRRLRVEVLRMRNGSGGGVAEVELDHETRAFDLAPAVAVPTSVRRAARA